MCIRDSYNVFSGDAMKINIRGVSVNYIPVSYTHLYDAMELALTSAYKKNFNSKTNVKVLFDRATGEIKVYSCLLYTS